MAELSKLTQDKDKDVRMVVAAGLSKVASAGNERAMTELSKLESESC